MRDWKGHIAARLADSGHAVDNDVVEELAQHAAAACEAARAEGLDTAAADARAEVLVAAWVAEGPSLRHRVRRPAAVAPPPPATSWTPGVLHDIRYAARLLRRQPSFALLVIGTMALGIAATTTLFGVTYGVLMKPLPWPDADRLVLLKETRGGNKPRFNSFSTASYLAWREQMTTVEEVGAWSSRTLTLAGAGDPERIRAAAVTSSLFNVLGVRPLLGDVFSAADEASGGVVVLSDGLWRERFGGDPGVLGRVVQLDGQPHRVVGVLSSAAAFPDREVRAWVPFRIDPPAPNSISMTEALARLRSGVSAAQAGAEGTARAAAVPRSANLGMTIRAIFGEDGAVQVTAVPLRDALTAEVRRPLVVLLVAVVLLFVAATGNAASLQLAQATSRRREMAVRAALGAGTARVTRQLLVESLVLGLTGGAAGVALALLLHRLLPSLLPADFPRVQDVAIDGVVLSFALLMSLAASLVCGLLPALRARRLDLVSSLSLDGTSPSGARGRTATSRIRTVIMAGQVAIACVLLIGASLLGRSFFALVRADRGFDPANVLTARIQMPDFAYSNERRHAIMTSIVARLGSMPGVDAVTFIDGPPLGIYGGTAFMLDDRQAQASSRTVRPGYFAAMGMRLVEGRDFTDADVSANRAVFIVNRAFARQYLRPTPAGQRVRGWVRENRGDWEVIGVVDDVRHRGVTEPAEPEVYRYREANDRRVSSAPTVIVRTAGDPAAVSSPLKAIVRAEDPLLIVDSLMTMEDRLLTGLSRPRLYAVLLTGFAVFALAIAATGLFGVLSYSVAQRSRELALRTALGAQRHQIVSLVALHGLAVTAAGLAVGLPAAVLLARAVGALLFGVRPFDPLTFSLVPVVLVGAALVACVPPAVRAARVDPLKALRSL